MAIYLADFYHQGAKKNLSFFFLSKFDGCIKVAGSTIKGQPQLTSSFLRWWRVSKIEGK